VPSDGLAADEQMIGDLLIRGAAADELQNFGFPPGQTAAWLAEKRVLDKSREQLSGHPKFAFEDGLYRSS